ncbi:MAG: FliM/FliN family flagellar motor switch protein [Bacillota bacterium]|jgi:flagellar motor switch protein FliN/FliY
MSDFFKTEEEIESFLSGKKTLVSKVKRVSFPTLNKMDLAPNTPDMRMLKDIKLNISAELGRTTITVGRLLGLKEGDVIELNKIAGEKIDIYASDQKLGLGEILVINEVFGIRLNSIGKEREKKEE